MYSWTLDRTLSHRMWRLMNDVLLILPVYFTYSCCLKKDFACLLEQRSKKIGQNVKGRSNFVLFNFALLSRLWRREVCKLCVDLLKIPAIFCLKTAYESIATVGESRVWWRADFQSGSRVLKSVKKGVLNLFLSISKAYNVISCQKVAKNTQILKIAKFAM